MVGLRTTALIHYTNNSYQFLKVWFMTKTHIPEGHCKKNSGPTYAFSALAKIPASQQGHESNMPVADGMAEEERT